MLKKCLSLLLAAILLFSLPFTVFAEEETTETLPEEPVVTTTTTIASTKDFLAFAEKCRIDSFSQNRIVELKADISLADTDFTGIPIFCGTFRGNGHTISGLHIGEEGSYAGLFRYLTDTALVQDLTIQATIQPEGSKNYVGAIAGSNAGRIENCSFTGILSGSSYVGGLVGTNKVSGMIENCQVTGSIHGEHYVGGIAGENMGVIRHCSNNAQINTTPQENTVELSQITLETLTDSEATNTVTDIGGIAGASGGVIRSCKNYGTVGYRHMGYNIGGIAGSQMGYIVDCRNYAEVYGRKDVGGIVGQMQPVTNIVFTEDTLQILRGQLDTLGSLTDRASAHAQGSASTLVGQIAGLQDKTSDAQDALEELLPEEGEPIMPDRDRLDAAQSALNSSFTNIQGSLSSIASTVQGTASTLNQDMNAISSQVKAMGSTLDNAGENIGGTIVDISDNDTPEDTAGKVASCENSGSILADLNVGGITGAIGLENSMDPEEDLQITGQESLNFDSELRAVILSCNNTGDIAANKQNAGGIAGWMSMGLARDCLNTGTLTADNASYVGGIAGQSTGFIRQCHANCTITGSSNVGGITGEATTISDCRSITFLTATEKKGGIAGFADSREEISGNFYMPINADIGAIDGISYDGCAQPLSPESFLALEDLKSVFRTVAVTFRFDDATEKRIAIPYGSSLTEADIPEIPQQEGSLSHWENLTFEPLYFDHTCTAVYVSKTTVIQSQSSQGGQPRLLAEGSFLPDAAITERTPAFQPVLSKGQTLVDVLTFTVSESATPITMHLRLPQDAEAPQLLIRDENGLWQNTDYSVQDSYLVFSAQPGEHHIAVVAEAAFPWLYVGIAAGVVLLGAVLWITIRKKKKPMVDTTL